MKNKILFLPFVLLFASSPITQSCKKYTEGPLFSLRSKTERLSNTWKVENYEVNGTDFTSLVSGYTETFTNDNKYSFDWGILGGSGNWAFQNNNKEVKISGNGLLGDRTLVILKLEEKTLWYYYMEGGEKHELHLIEK